MTRQEQMFSRVFFVGLVILGVVGCASREPKVPDEVYDTGLPEVRRIAFSGNEQFLDSTLTGEIVTQGRPLLRPWKRGEAFDSVALEDDLLRLRRFYFQQGFLQASATVEQLERDVEANTIEIRIAIDEGPETIVETLRLTGTLPPEIPTVEALLGELPLRPGDRLSKEPFERSVAMLVERLENAGYAQAEVIPDTQVDPMTHKAAVIFDLAPGKRRRFGSFSVKGAEQVPNHVIERTVTVNEGDTFSAATIAASRDNIFALGMFRDVSSRTLNIDDPEAPVDIEFRIQERKPRTVEFNIGFSTVESVRLGAKWSHRNIFEEANSLSVLARVSGISQSIEVDLRDPYFLSPDTSVDYRAFVINKETLWTDLFEPEDPFPAYDFRTVGAGWRLQHDISERLTGIAGLELTSTDFFNVELSPEEAKSEGAVDNDLFIQFVEAQWNNRDSNLNPTSGEWLRAKLDHSNTELISDDSFIKLELEGRYYHRVSRHTVLAGRLLLGGIEPYGGSDTVPNNVRFFAGGPGSVRGYKLNRLGPVDSTGDPVGGNSLLEGNLEVRYPIVGDLGGTAFVDFGNVFSEAFNYRLDDLKYSVGAGITYATPVGPVRAEVAYAIDPDDRGDTSLFFFSIGQAF